MTICLFDNRLRCPVEAELVPMTDEHVTVLNLTWVPEFHRRQESSEKDQDFLMWNRGVKYVDLLTQRHGVRAYVVSRAGEVQGVLALSGTPEPSRLVKIERVLIVRYLATAPWNRPALSGGARFRWTGTVLLGQAVLDSMAAGCLGRLGLHSLNASDDFYRKLAFCDLGPDPAERGLRYFELSVLDAARLLDRTTHLHDGDVALPAKAMQSLPAQEAHPCPAARASVAEPNDRSPYQAVNKSITGRDQP